MSCCIKGYLGSELIHGQRAMTKQKRLETVKILKENGADINVQSYKIKMTPLHWAAYNDDHALVSYLLS